MKMSLKALLIPAYGSSLYKETQQLQRRLCKVASSKNQMIFITRCLHHSITPRFLRTACPIKNIICLHLDTKQHLVF